MGRVTIRLYRAASTAAHPDATTAQAIAEHRKSGRGDADQAESLMAGYAAGILIQNVAPPLGVLRCPIWPFIR